MENSTAGLTSYVILSLFDAKVDVPDTVQVNAKYCIRSQNNPDQYSMVISSYALFKVHWISEASRFLEKAIKVARKEAGFMWWSTRGILPLSRNSQHFYFSVTYFSRVRRVFRVGH